MADTGVEVFQGLLGTTTDTLLYTVPGSTTTKVTHIRIANVTGTSANIRLTGGTAGAISNAKAWLWDVAIPGNGFYSGDDLGIFLPTGYVIRAQAGTASALTVSIYGLAHT